MSAAAHEFIRKLKDSTLGEAEAAPVEPDHAPDHVPGARAPRGLEVLTALVIGAAHRALGAH